MRRRSRAGRATTQRKRKHRGTQGGRLIVREPSLAARGLVKARV